MSPQVFCHYMVGGVQESQAYIDVSQAKAMGFDAFALNVISTESWSANAIAYLFQAAAAIGFHLFFSFDMTYFTDSSQFIWLLQMYVGNPAYYYYNSLPFVSTFRGGDLTFGHPTPQLGWHANYKQSLSGHGIDTYFVPSFSDSSVPPSEMYDAYPVADGLFSWESAWPWASEGRAKLNCTTDDDYMAAAKAVKKTFMMPMSSFQFKHLDAWQNWYRRGELTLTERIPHVLNIQPHFLEIQTWNDAGESSYIGNVWPDTIGPECAAYTDNFDHSGWQAILTPFIAAYKTGAKAIKDVVPLNGRAVAGVFWYRTILKTTTCSSDPLGKPRNWQIADDVVNVAILLSEAAVGAKVNVYSGGVLIGSETGAQGLNSWSIPGLRVGAVRVEVMPKTGTGVLLSGTGSMDVTADSAICNYNYQVKKLS